jgi:hypothetical protein
MDFQQGHRLKIYATAHTLSLTPALSQRERESAPLRRDYSPNVGFWGRKSAGSPRDLR